MKYKNLLMPFTFSLFIFFHAASFACSTLVLPNSEEKLIVKNYDWSQAHALLFVNKAGIQKKALVIKPWERGVEWVSKYGSVTFNQYGRELPLGGLNEAGLLVENMWLDETKYPRAQSRRVINELQWIQYQLDNFATVEEVLAHLDQVRISKLGGTLHYMVCDVSGACATIDMVKDPNKKRRGKTVVHAGKNLPFQSLTNSTYAESLKTLRQHIGFGGQKSIPTDEHSLSRFVRGTHLARDYRPGAGESAVEAGFRILDGVKQEDTRFNIIYSRYSGDIYFRTTAQRSIKKLNLNSFDFSCSSPTLSLDIDQVDGGNVEDRFVEYTTEINRELVRKGAKLVPIPLPNFIVEKFVQYPERHTRCVEP